MKTRNPFSFFQRSLLVLALVAFWNPGALTAADFDPSFVLAKKLTVGDGATNDHFGAAVSVSGDTMVVKAVTSVYVFERNAGGTNNWGQVRKFAFSGGSSMALDGDILVLGNLYGTVAGGIPGAAYVYERNRGGVNNWGLVKQLAASDGEDIDEFGISVSVSGDVIVVGADKEDPNNRFNQGSAYVFERHAGGTNNWGEVKKLIASDGESEENFGWSVAVSGEVIVVGAYLDWDRYFNQGSAYVFERNWGGNGNWGQAKKLTASDATEFESFGFSVAVSGEVIVVATPSGDVGTNFNQGSAYVFRRNQGGTNNWGQVKKLSAVDGENGDYFGNSVSVSGNLVAVGAPEDIIGSDADRGSAYVFEREAGGANNWGQIQKLTASDGRANDYFGAVAVSGDILAVGAPWADVGVRQDQGAVYVFWILPGLTIFAQPISQSVRLGGSVTNSVAALTTNGPITYKWRFNGTNIPNATNSVLVITNAQLAHEGVYSVVVADGAGSITSSNATLTVLAPLTMTQPLLPQSLVSGGEVTFSVAVTGHPPPFGYEWRRVSPATSLASNVSNERVAFFTLTNVQAGSYRVIVRNAATPGGVSSTTALTILADSDGDGLPDVWEEANLMCADAALDCDYDGMTNLEEYRAGTDPTNAASGLRINRITAGNSATLEFDAVSNRTYTVQHTDRVGGGTWSKLADVVARGTNRTETATDSGAGTNRYYRVVTPRQP